MKLSEILDLFPALVVGVLLVVIGSLGKQWYVLSKEVNTLRTAIISSSAPNDVQKINRALIEAKIKPLPVEQTDAKKE